MNVKRSKVRVSEENPYYPAGNSAFHIFEIMNAIISISGTELPEAQRLSRAINFTFLIN